MKMMVMRDNHVTLQAAITTATNEQNLSKRFDLRSGNHSQVLYGIDTDPQPMEVDHI